MQNGDVDADIDLDAMTVISVTAVVLSARWGDRWVAVAVTMKFDATVGGPCTAQCRFCSSRWRIATREALRA
eukprot:6212715-Prymnesium_polylepis.1